MCLFEYLRVAEAHIQNFQGMINSMQTDDISACDKVTLLPLSGCARCLQAMMAEIEATPALQHTMSTGQDSVNILVEYRGILVDALDKLIFSTWRSCARQIYAAVDPVSFIGVVGVPGNIAGTPLGLSDQFEG